MDSKKFQAENITLQIGENQTVILTLENSQEHYLLSDLVPEVLGLRHEGNFWKIYIITEASLNKCRDKITEGIEAFSLKFEKLSNATNCINFLAPYLMGDKNAA